MELKVTVNLDYKEIAHFKVDADPKWLQMVLDKLPTLKEIIGDSLPKTNEKDD